MAVEIIYEIEDSSGDSSSSSVRVADDTTLAGLEGFGVAWAQAMNNLILGVIRSATAYIKPAISGLTGNTIEGTADVEHIGKFEFLTEEGQRVKFNIPAISETITQTTTVDEINQAQTDVAALIAAMENGINVGGALIRPCDIGEVFISDTVFAREAAKNSGARR